ncbi:MAG: SRPBCC family protein [Ilumatobacteraceae bacterium]|nr:SRPBCC family protein [Acidimicrobiales bacterium]MCB9393204.1 SRPBCC family protein [Acidimicrobiaceae bacterium]
MEKLLNEFVVHRPIDETWVVLTDVERIAPCMPGAQLQEIEGDIYRGVVKVKLGAISTAFKGQATFVERDDPNHRAVLHGEGRDTTGKGNADAMITAQLEPIDATTTKCVVQTDLRITGKVAQFGRGIMADVSKKLMEQFAHNLNTMLDESGATSETAPEAAPETAPEAAPEAIGAADAPEAATASTDEAVAPAAAESAADPAGAPAADPATATRPATETPTVRKIDGPANEPIELSGLAGTAVLKRLLPTLAALVVALLVVRRFRK